MALSSVLDAMKWRPRKRELERYVTHPTTLIPASQIAYRPQKQMEPRTPRSKGFPVRFCQSLASVVDTALVSSHTMP